METPQAERRPSTATTAILPPSSFTDRLGAVSIWTDFGFRENPYSTSQLPPTEEGETLLVGRRRELESLKRLLLATESHPTVEGDNGVGKSSLVAVAGYQLKNEHGTGGMQELVIPLEEHFQLTPTLSTEELERRVYFAVAHAFIQNHDQLRRGNLDPPNVGDIEQWLSNPQFREGGGISTPVGGVERPSRSPNTSSGFDESGFRETIRQWLAETFPSAQSGAFICVIDNLELLNTSQAARQQLEELRDSLLSLRGLRWILCGARGIVRSAAASPRLSGVLAEPLEVGPVSDQFIPDVVDRRIGAFKIRNHPFVPIDGHGFLHTYHVLHKNLRDAFQFAQRFAIWLAENQHTPDSPQDRFELLEVWLAEEAEKSEQAAQGVTPRAWEVFDRLREEFSGDCSPGDFESFGFTTNQAMRPHIRNLEEANLVQSRLTDDDRRRKTIGITPAGWLVVYRRAGFSIQ